MKAKHPEQTDQTPLVLLRGGGDLGTGVAARLHRAGFRVVVTEIEHPLAVRRLVALAEAVFSGDVFVEDLRGQRVEDPSHALHVLANGVIPVLVDPDAFSRHVLNPAIIIDARMCKAKPDLDREAAHLVIGLGPGFTAGGDCHAVIETNRGHTLGRVIRNGAAQVDTMIPEAVSGIDRGRVLRAPSDGTLHNGVRLGTLLEEGDCVAEVAGLALRAPFGGALRGLVHDGVDVTAGMKIGDLDPRGIPAYCAMISDKALAVGGGVLEAILADSVLRNALGSPCG